jgi:hypothetical protein
MIDVPERRLIPAFLGNAGLNGRPTAVVPVKAGTHTPCALVSAVWQMPSFTTHARGYGSRLSPGRRLDMSPPSRDSIRPSFANSFALKKREGAGKTGCALHPRSHVQGIHKQTHMSIQVQRKQSGLPCAMVLTAYFVLSPVRPELVCHRRPQEA